MVDGLISAQTFDCDAIRGGSAFHGLEDYASVPACPTPTRMDRPDRMHAYAAMASALVDAGFVNRSAADAGYAPFIDLPALKAITERSDVPGRVGSLIRVYLGSFAEIPASVVPDPMRLHGPFEVSRWCLEIGRLAAGAPAPACQ